MEEFYDITQNYFSYEEWGQMEEEDRLKYSELCYIYHACTNLGITVVVPDFMQWHDLFNDFEQKNVVLKATEIGTKCQFCLVNYSSDGREQHAPFCRKKFRVDAGHSSEVDPSKKAYNCKLCDYTTNRFYHLEKHQRKHRRPKPFPCKFCTKAFDLKGHLNTHINSRHAEKEKEHKCQFCSFETHHKFNLRQHEKIHVNKKMFSCDVCNKSFHQKGQLDRHKLIHSVQKEKPFKCTLCDKSYLQKYDLKRHMNAIHLEIKQFKCDKCIYETAKRSHLKRHMFTHLDNKPFKCSYCSFQCCQSRDIRNHMKSAHNLS